jgi:hypothetical protein
VKARLPYLADRVMMIIVVVNVGMSDGLLVDVIRCLVCIAARTVCPLDHETDENERNPYTHLLFITVLTSSDQSLRLPGSDSLHNYSEASVIDQLMEL